MVGLLGKSDQWSDQVSPVELGGKPFSDNHVFEDAQNFRVARASFKVREFYPHKAAVLINSLL